MWEIELAPPLLPIIILSILFFFLILLFSALLYGIFRKTYFKLDDEYFQVRILPCELVYLAKINLLSKYFISMYIIQNDNNNNNEIAYLKKKVYSLQNNMLELADNSSIIGSNSKKIVLRINQEEIISNQNFRKKIKILNKNDYINRGLL